MSKETTTAGTVEDNESGVLPAAVCRWRVGAVGAGEKLTLLRRLRFDPLWRWRRRPGCW